MTGVKLGPTAGTLKLLPTESVDLPCMGHQVDLWFSERPAEIERAKAWCGGCPVRDRCLAGALAREEAAGVWGGELIVNGAVVAFKRGRGRPRKHAA